MGHLNSTEVDHCTLHFTWTAPYTLQGVPINYYNITITRHSDGAVLGSYTTNTTEFLYSVSRLGETLEVVVAPVNDVGTGNSSSILALSPTTSELSNFQIIHVQNTYVYFHCTHTVSTVSFPLGDHYTVRIDRGNITMWNYAFSIRVTLNAPTCICATIVDYLITCMSSELCVRMDLKNYGYS